MNNRTPSSSSDSEISSKIKMSFKRSFVKNCHATFDKKMRFNFHALKLDDDDLFKIGQNTYLCHKIILDHAQFRSGQSTSAGD